MTAEVKLETTEERLRAGTEWMRKVWLSDDAELPDDFRFAYRVLLEFATLLAEVARLSTQLQIANAEIVRLSASREKIREQLEGEVARLNAELADAHAHILTDREELAACMIRRSLATGHGDTLNDLLRELDWQLAEATTREAAARAEGFEAGAKLARSAP